VAKRPPRTILELAIAIGGYRKGFRACVFIEQWTIAQHALGHEPTVIEAADWWKEPHSSWFKRQSEFREIFDLLDNPAPLAEQIIAQAEDRAEQVGSVIAALARMPVPPSVAPATA